MKTRTVIILVFLFYSFPFITFSEVVDSPLPGNCLQGIVIDQSSGVPMEYASVALYRKADSSLVSGTITNTEGKFTLDKIDAGDYYLMASFVGYKSTNMPLSNLSKQFAKTKVGTIALVPSASELDEVRVTGTKAKIEYMLDKRVVNVDKDLSSRGGSAVDALQNTPSVQVDPQGNLTLRGSSDYMVLVDGKPSLLKGSDALKQIPAGAIKQIEVITNPSAKYEADGQAGIINVIMKKEVMQGFSGSINYGISTSEKQNGNLMLSYRLKKLNIFAGADYANNTYRNTVKIDTRTLLPSGTVYNDGFTKEFNTNNNFAVKSGLDYEFNPKNSASVSASYSRQGYDNGGYSENASWTNENEKIYTSNDNYTDIYGDVIRLTADFKHTFNENSNLLVTNTYSGWNGRDANKMEYAKTDVDFSNSQIITLLEPTKDNSNYQNRLNIDYTTPLLKGKFEAGVQYRYEYRFEDVDYKYYDAANQRWLRNDNFCYIMNYYNSIYSGYAMFSKTFWGIQGQLGIRSEYFTRDMYVDGITTDSLAYNKFMFYPSVHISKSFKNQHQLQASYSRRIRRPQPYVLNTIPRFVDENNIFIGNTRLTPEYTDGFELNYMLPVGKASLSAQTYYRRTSNPMTTVRYLGSDGKMYHQLTNGKYQQAFGIELGANLKVLSWWSMNANADLYHYELNTDVLQENKMRSNNTWEIRWINNFNLKTGTSLQSVAYYRGPNVDAGGKIDGFYTVNLSAGQSFFKGKLNVTLRADNVFSSVKFGYHAEGQGYNNDYYIANEGASFTVNVAYKLNNFKSKKAGRADDTEFKGGGMF